MVALPSVYPRTADQRDKWILDRRRQRSALNPFVPYDFSLEDERSKTGELVPVATVFLTNRECPWKCLMCDLWRNTLQQNVPQGAIPLQIDHALNRLGPARQIKLYNSGSFFDHNAIPTEDYEAIAGRLNSFERVIVECHPALIGERCLRFRDLLKGRLEVAIGLETAHPEVLSRLNKRMTLNQFSRAADWLATHEIDLRTFVLVKPPFLNEEEALLWAKRSLSFAFSCGASVVSLIPTRAGNGAMDELASRGEFSLPKLHTLEQAAAYGLTMNRGRVFADLWDLHQISTCNNCYNQRRNRLLQMNLQQSVQPNFDCTVCGSE